MVQDSCFLRCCCIFQVLIFLEFSVYISCMFPMPILWVSYHSSTCCRVICFLSRPQHEKTEKKGGEGEDKSGAGPCSGAGDFALLILNLPTHQKKKKKTKQEVKINREGERERERVRERERETERERVRVCVCIRKQCP